MSTCFEPTGGGIQCNARRTIYAGTWGLAATDVKAGTKFFLSFSYTGLTGLVAY